MEANPRTLLIALLLPALLAAASCASEPPPPTGEVALIETKSGAAIVETYQMTATVAGLDFDNRKVVLLFSDGHKTTYKADKQVVNFDQLKLGDQVRATVVEELAVYLSRDKAPPSVGAGAAVALAPKGAKPGIVLASTVEVTATVKTIDVKGGKVSVQLADGTSKTLKVGKGVDLTKIRPGDDVTVQVTEAVAILVEKS